MDVYVDNAATTKMSKEVIDSMLPYFDTCFANPSSIHSLGQRAKEALSLSRTKIAKILNCDRREIYFTSGGSESDNQAIISASKIGIKQNKKHIISTTFEHPAVLRTLEQLEKQGFKITLLEVNENGIIKLEDLENEIRPETCLVTIMYANNEIGTIQSIGEIGKICKENGILFHTDAVQAVGHIDIDVKDQNIDMLSFSAHKFNGPKGVGVLYAKKGIQLENLIYGGSQERGKRAGTENLPSIVGMSVALENAYRNLEERENYILSLRNKLIGGLKEIPQSFFNGDKENRLSNNVNFSFLGVEGEALLLLLNERGIYASAGSACSSGALESSHVLLAIGREKELAKSSIRLTLSYENNEEEIEYIIKNITELVTYLRSMSPVWKNFIEGDKI